MAKVVQQKKMGVSLKYLYQAITDFERYDEFLPEVVTAKVRPGASDSSAEVDFELEVIKRFQYTLCFHMEEGKRVNWSLKESNFFKENKGSWVLKSAGDEATDVDYELDVGFGFFVPKMITKKLTEINLPKMFEQFEMRAQQLQAEAS